MKIWGSKINKKKQKRKQVTYLKKEWETAKYINVCWPMLLKCSTTAVKVRSLLLIWTLKCQRQSSRPPITSAHAGEARSRSVTHHSPSSHPLHAVISSASFPCFLLMLVQAGLSVLHRWCVCVLREFWRHFGGTLEELMFGFCCGCFHPKPFERFAVMNSWDLVVRCPSFFMSLPLLHSTRSCFPLVGTWPDQSASTIAKMLLMLIVTAVGLATGSITLHSLKESNRSIWNAAPNHLPSSLSSAFCRHTSSHPPRSTWRVNWLWNCRFCRKHRRVCKNFSILH